MYKTLYFLRHAKAVSQQGDDHERPLSDRGERDARAVGEYLKRQRIVPGLALCSTSLRTRQTLHLLEQGMGEPLECRMAAKLYLATPKEMLEVIEGLEDTVGSLMVIGHNPTLHQLAFDLAEQGDEKLLSELSQRFPTAALAEIQYPAAAWNEIGPKKGVLKRFVMPEEAANV